jgi:hypothetical protein
MVGIKGLIRFMGNIGGPKRVEVQLIKELKETTCSLTESGKYYVPDPLFTYDGNERTKTLLKTIERRNRSNVNKRVG